MSKFKDLNVNLGYVKPGQELKPFFEFNGEQKVKELKTTCNCIKPKVDYNRGGVVVQYQVTDIPYHLAQAGVHELPNSKTATVVFEDDTEEVLIMNFIVKK